MYLGGNSLSAFLQRSSAVMESLLVEMKLKDDAKSELLLRSWYCCFQNNNVLCTENSDRSNRRDGNSYRSAVVDRVGTIPSMFDDTSGWIALGACRDNSSGYLEYVRSRPISFIQFSSLQPNLLITGHPPPNDEKEDEDLKPNSALYCIWDVTFPDSPIRLLSSPGFPSAASFSAGQSFLVLAGTLEGSLHLWDLRESNSLHIDRDAADLKVFTGVRKACFTTYDHVSSSSNNSSSINSGAGGQHAAAIVCVDSIDTGGGESRMAVSSQFITLDDAGFITIWLTSEDVSVANSFSGDNDPLVYKGNIGGENEAEVGLSPQGMVKLVKRRVIPPDCSLFYSHHQAGLQMTAGVLPVLATNPIDPSILLVSVGRGLVYRGSSVQSTQAQSPHQARWELHESPTAPWCFRRTATKNVQVSISDPAAGDRLDAWAASDKRFASELDCWNDVSYFSPVTCIVCSSGKSEFRDGSYVLVGRADGTLDLYSSKTETPVLSWSLPAEVEMCKSSGGRATGLNKRGVALVKWMPSSVTSFVAVDTAGIVYLFNLLVDPDHAIEIDSSGEDRQHYRSLYQAGVSMSGSHVTMSTGPSFHVVS